MGSSTPFPGDLSPFRPGFLIVSLFIGGSWTPVPMVELGDDGVTIKRGGRAISDRAEPSQCTFRLKDPSGKWSPRHPASPYYGQIGRGTPVRVQVEMTPGVVLDRWYGEVVTWQPRWTRKGAESAHVEVECAGALRRIGQGTGALLSPIRRAIGGIGANLLGYWPMEDDDRSTSFAAALPQGKRATWVGVPTLAGDDSFVASRPLPTLGTAKVTAQVPAYTSTAHQIRWLAKYPSTTPNGTGMLDVKMTGGTLGSVSLEWQTASTGSFLMRAFDRDGTQVGLAAFTFGAIGGLNNRPLRYSLQLTQSGSDVNVTVAAYEPGAALATSVGINVTGVTTGRVSTVTLNPARATADGPIGHLSVEKAITSIFDVSVSVLVGHAGERAPDRVARLATENGLTSTVSSGPGTVRLGAQSFAPLPDLLAEAAAADGGTLFEPRSTTDIGYRSLQALWQTTPVVIPYTENMLKPFEPVEDDSDLRNVVTVTRDGGSSATVEKTDGTLGTATVGIYDEAVTLSLYEDAQAEQHASWRVAKGTLDEPRWPVIGVDLADPRIVTTLRDSLLGLGLFSVIQVTGAPSWLPPLPIRQLVAGYTETITPLSYKLEFNCEPASVYEVARYQTAGATARYSTAGTVLASPATSTATTLTTTVGATAWGHDDGDYEIVVGGEVMLVTAVGTPTTTQPLTVVRSRNGVVKAHAAGATVDLADPERYGLQGD